MLANDAHGTARMSPPLRVHVQPAPVVALRHVLLGVVAAGLIVFALTAGVFCTGLFDQVISNTSAPGLVYHNDRRERLRPPTPNVREVLLVGDSRIDQGFSAWQANHMGSAQGYHFSSIAVPSTTLRVWSYQLTHVDPQASRYSMVVVPLSSLVIGGKAENFNDRLIDAESVTPVLRWADKPFFIASYDKPANAYEAAKMVLLPGLGLRGEVQNFLTHPLQRWIDAKEIRRLKPETSAGDEGNAGSLAGLTWDATTQTAVFPPQLTEAEKQEINAYFSKPSALPRDVDMRYVRRWLGKILEHYRGSATQVVIVELPEGPLSRQPPGERQGAIDPVFLDLAQGQRVAVVPRGTFSFLEQPQFYHDSLHHNGAGRRAFTKKLVDEITAGHLQNIGI